MASVREGAGNGRCRIEPLAGMKIFWPNKR